MALTSYATLKTAIGDWLARSDLTTAIDDFIDLAEARIARELRVSAMETALSDTIASGVVSVPTGFLEFVTVYLDGTPTRPLEVKSPQWILGRYPDRAATGKPIYIGREAANFMFGPYPDSAYTLLGSYYAKLSPLGDGTGGTVTTNYLITDAPDLILFGALYEAAPYLGEDQRIQLWDGRYREAMEGCNKRDRDSRFSSRMSLASVST